MQYINSLLYGTSETKTETELVKTIIQDKSNGVNGAKYQLQQYFEHDNKLCTINEPSIGESIVRIDPVSNVEFNTICQFEIKKDIDVLDHLNIHVRLKPAPNGYRYKRYWPLLLIKGVQTYINGSFLYEDTNDSIALSCLTKLAINNSDDENLFNFDSQERSSRSRRHTETCIPLTRMQLDLWLMSMDFIEFKVKLGILRDILEYDKEIQTPIKLDLESVDIIESFRLHGIGRFLSKYTCNTIIENYATKEQITELVKFRKGFDIPNPINEISFYKYISYYSTAISANSFSTLVPTRIDCTTSGVYCATHAYIWVKNVDFKAIKTISAICDSHIRLRLTGHEARTAAKNIYCLTYSSGVVEEDGYAHGLLLSTLDSYIFEIEWEIGIPSQVDVVIIHRAQNKLHTTGGKSDLGITGLGSAQIVVDEN